MPFLRHPLTLILLLRLALSLGFALHTPLWERSDEMNHYRYAHFIAREGRLPTPADMPNVPDGYEIYVQFDQPPLYYLLLAPIVAAFDDDALLRTQANPFPVCPAQPFEFYYLHSRAEEFPPQGTALAAWLARLLTIGLGLGATALLWQAARWLRPQQPQEAHLTAALFATWPASVEMTTWLNNDALVLFGGALALAGLARFYVQPDRRSLALLAAGAVVSLAAKLTGLAVVPALVGVVGAHLLRKQPPRRRFWIVFSMVLLLSIVAFAGWSLARCGQPVCRLHRYTLMWDDLNEFVYKLLRLDYYAEGLGHLTQTATVPQISEAVPADPLVMLALALLLFAGLVLALIAGQAQPSGASGWLWLLLAGALGLAFARVWWLQVGYFHVRYLAAALPALVLLLARGYDLLGAVWPPLRLGLLGFFAALSLLFPLSYYRPAYVAPPRAAALPQSAQLIEPLRFAGGIELGAYEIIEEGPRLTRLRLYWRSEQPSETPLFAMIETQNAQGLPVERCGLTLGTALWPSTQWTPGEWVAQDFRFQAWIFAQSFDAALYGIEAPSYIASTYDPQRSTARLAGQSVPVNRTASED